MNTNDRPDSCSFRVTNAVAWILEAHREHGYTAADIRFVCDVLEWTEPIRKALAADEKEREKP